MMREKREVRTEVLQKRAHLTAVQCQKDSRIIMQMLEHYLSREFELYLYASYGKEVDTWELMKQCLEQKRKIALPRVLEDKIHMEFYYIQDLSDLEEGYRGIFEPAKHCLPVQDTPQKIIILPGVAFDHFGNRVGYGKGFYDRYLHRHDFAKKIAVAFEFQMYDKIQAEKNDMQADIILTEKAVYSRP